MFAVSVVLFSFASNITYEIAAQNAERRARTSYTNTRYKTANHGLCLFKQGGEKTCEARAKNESCTITSQQFVCTICVTQNKKDFTNISNRFALNSRVAKFYKMDKMRGLPAPANGARHASTQALVTIPIILKLISNALSAQFKVK